MLKEMLPNYGDRIFLNDNPAIYLRMVNPKILRDDNFLKREMLSIIAHAISLAIHRW